MTVKILLVLQQHIFQHISNKIAPAPVFRTNMALTNHTIPPNALRKARIDTCITSLPNNTNKASNQSHQPPHHGNITTFHQNKTPAKPATNHITPFHDLQQTHSPYGLWETLRRPWRLCLYPRRTPFLRRLAAPPLRPFPFHFFIFIFWKRFIGRNGDCCIMLKYIKISTTNSVVQNRLSKKQNKKYSTRQQ